MNAVAMTTLLIVLWGVFAWSAIRRWNLAAFEAREPRVTFAGEALRQRVRDVLALGQKKLVDHPLASIAHILIFLAGLVLLLNSMLFWGRGYAADFDFWGLLAVDHPLGAAFSIIKEALTVLVVLAASVFVCYRMIDERRRMTLSGAGLSMLGILVVMMLADMLCNGARLVLVQRAMGEPLQPRLVEPVASVWASWLAGLNLGNGALSVLLQAGFWTHSSLVLILLNILPYSRYFPSAGSAARAQPTGAH